MKNIRRERSNHLIELIECLLPLRKHCILIVFCLIMVFGVSLHYVFLLEDIASHLPRNHRFIYVIDHAFMELGKENIH